MKNEDCSLATKRKLAEALKKLMMKKDFDKITVRELVEAANITRPTFYYHFTDIYDLLTWIYNNELLAELKKGTDNVTWQEGILHAMHYIDKNRKFCLNVYNSVGRDTLEHFFRESTADVAKRAVEQQIKDTSASESDVVLITTFYTDALASMLVRWLKEPQGRTPEQIISLLEHSVDEGICIALEQCGAKARPA